MNIAGWTRVEFEGTPIYLQADKPDWFVPNSAGDGLLRKIMSSGVIPDDVEALGFLERLPEYRADAYDGRADILSLNRLSEVWFHLTNNCNQACKHCLFSCSNAKTSELSAHRLLHLARQAVDLGCHVFALTGGEPFVHGDITQVIDGLLEFSGTHVVVLTNGLLLSRFEKELARWPDDRVHLQISLDGMSANHDALRGRGAFSKIERELEWIAKRHLPYTVSMCAGKPNQRDMPKVVEYAASLGADAVHFMWYFARGRGNLDGMGEPEELFRLMKEASEVADKHGIGIDNLDALRTQVFAPPGTKHDGSNGAWESIAVGPDGFMYPSAALVGLEQLATGINHSLSESWHNSHVLEKLRSTTASGMDSVWRYLTGGGDPDHSYVFSGDFAGPDPYHALYEKLLQWLISREASCESADGPPRLRLKMGDILESCGAHGSVSMVHSNCLLSVSGKDSRTVVKEFYSEAALEPRADIVNPVSYPDEFIEHIPEKYRFRGYGCGSPILDAGLLPGDTVLDLGCGGGVECFIASRLVGKHGHVVGVDMLEPMLSMARRGGKEVAESLGYGNLEFRKEYLEELSVDDASIDVVVSNCVINLSKNKRRTFSEVFRVLKPGGRLVVADVVSEHEPDPGIRNDDQLRGECIAGALTQKDLFALLEECGFTGRTVVKRSPYRTVRGQSFFSMTFEATKPTADEDKVRVLYRGPYAKVLTDAGTLLLPGSVKEVSRDEIAGHGDEILILDEQGSVVNVDMGTCCTCAVVPEDGQSNSSNSCCSPAEPVSISSISLVPLETKYRSGCMVCGAELEYHGESILRRCSYCGAEYSTQAICTEGHFVCDSCHTHDGMEVIRRICLSNPDKDMIALLDRIRNHPAVPIHGPEHHAMVPGIILSTYRALGGDVSDGDIEIAIDRGAKVPGGYCGFVGACGAALGVGIAFSVILGANPIKAHERMAVQTAVHAAMGKVAQFDAARCCQRDSWAVLIEAASLSKNMLPKTLIAEYSLVCKQKSSNKECMGKFCPIF